MNLRHSITCALHRREGLSIDVRRLDRVYLLLQCRYLGGSLLESVLMLLLSSKRGLCSYNNVSAEVQVRHAVSLMEAFLPVQSKV